jgi:hypothetical protein
MKLIVLDFDKNITYVYNVLENTKKEEVENILKERGHRTHQCQWMLTKNDIITK